MNGRCSSRAVALPGSLCSRLRVTVIVRVLGSARRQWLIIHGRADGKLLAPLFVFRTSRDGLDEQQEQPGACEALYSASVFGACALRSFTTWALRWSAGMQAKCGAVRMTRGDDVVQLGQSCGRSHSAIGRMSVKGPQASQRYS